MGSMQFCKKKKKQNSYKSNLTLIKNVYNFRSIFNDLNDAHHDFRTAFFVIVLTTENPNPVEIVQSIFYHLYSKFIVNVYVLVNDFFESGKAIAYSYRFYTELLHCNRIQLVKSFIYYNGIYDDLEKNQFPMKLKQFHKCPLYMGVQFGKGTTIERQYNNGSMVLIGLDANVLYTLASVLNFSLDIIVTTPVMRLLDIIMALDFNW